MVVAIPAAPQCSHGMQANIPSLAEHFGSCKRQQQCCHPNSRKAGKAPAHSPQYYYPRSLELLPRYKVPCLSSSPEALTLAC